VKRKARTIAKKLLIGVERILGNGPYARIQSMEETVRQRDSQIESLRERSRARRLESERLRERLRSAAEANRALRELNQPRSRNRTSSSDSVGVVSSCSTEPSVKSLLSTAWGGWWEYGRECLEMRALDSSQEPMERKRAFIALAELARNDGNGTEELDLLHMAARSTFPRPPDRKLLLQMAYLHIELGDVETADRLIRAFEQWSVEIALLEHNARMAKRSLAHDRSRQEVSFRDALNCVFSHFGLLELENPAEPATDRLPIMAPRRTAQTGMNGPLVSIIVPAYNCDRSLSLTLSSLVQQDWTEIEIIVVDDASTDSTFNVASRVSRQHPRITVLRNSENRGAYATRNAGLAAAQGDYITVCDAGDWAHPSRVRLQVTDLLASGSAMNWTQLVRCGTDLRFRPRNRGLGRFIHDNPSSLMFHAALLEACGGWDEIRVSGDTDLRLRAQRLVKEQPRRVAEGCPMTLGVLEPTSLTQSAHTTERSRYRGVRNEYLESAEFARLAAAAEARRKAAWSVLESPLIVRPRRIRVSTVSSGGDPFDLVFVGDFSSRSCESLPMLELAETAAQRGRKVGLIHLPVVRDSQRRRSQSSRSRVAALEGEWIAPGDSIRCRLTLCSDSLPLWDSRPMDDFPRIISERMWVLLRSRLASQGYESTPRDGLMKAIAAYFPQGSGRLRLLRDIEWNGSRAWSSDLGVGAEIESGSPHPMVSGSLLSLLRNRMSPPESEDRDQSISVSEAFNRKIALLGCPDCSDGVPATESLELLGVAAARRAAHIELPNSIRPRGDQSAGPSFLGWSLIAAPDSDSLTSIYDHQVHSVRRGLYWPSLHIGGSHCWEPLVAAAGGARVATRALAGPAGYQSYEGVLEPHCTEDKAVESCLT
jgi:hypothetical protein